MLQSFFQKFTNIPLEIRAAIGSESQVKTLEMLENKYGVNLAQLAVSVLAREVPIDHLSEAMVRELGMERVKAASLADELVKTFFAPVLFYLVSGTTSATGRSELARDNGPQPPQKNAAMSSRNLADQSEVRRATNSANGKSSKAVSGFEELRTPPHVPNARITRPKAAFYFDVEDERELDTFRAQMKGDEDTRATYHSGLERMVVSIVDKSGVKFSDEGGDVLRKRYENIVSLRLRDIRDMLETKEALARGRDKGGMGFDPVTIERVSALIEEGFTSLHAHGGIDQVLSSSTEGSRQTSAMPTEGEIYAPFEKSSSLETPPIVEELRTTPTPTPPPLARPVERHAPAFARSSDDSRTRVQDVRVQQKLMGPIDELATMTITDFRALSAQPQGSTAKILDKLSLLRNEGEDKYAQGVKGWRTSPAVRAYVAEGIEALKSRQRLFSAIEARRGAGQEFVTEEEFGAIARLNAALRL